ncbi:Acg family FMN-binding oxidoreductase [Parabacteroides sp.]
MKTSLSCTRDISPDFVYMLELAMKAPSGHNTQPWLFRVGEDRIEILPDLDRALPVVDPDHRELFISLGCAAENLYMAAEAKGYIPEMIVSETGGITMLLKKRQTAKETVSFVREIVSRQTNRGVYTGEEISADQLDDLRSVSLEANIGLHMWSKKEAEFDTLSSYIFEGNTRQMNDPLFKQELKSWMRFNKRHEQAMSDGLSYAVFGAPNLPRFISEMVMGGVLKAGIQNKGDKKKIGASSHLVLFTSRGDTLPEWILLGRSLQRFLLRATKRNVAYAFLNQPCEIRDLSCRMAKDLSLIDEYPTLILRLGYAKRKMPYSPRKPWQEKLTF